MTPRIQTRVSVTDLDQLIWYRRLEDMTADELAARFRREGEENLRMALGTAFHKALEDAGPGESDVLEVGGFRFAFKCSPRISIPQLAEIPATKTIEVDGIEVTLSGKVDGIDGLIVRDYKTASKLDPEGFADSFQWRAYLEIFDADVFEYQVFQVKPKTKQTTPPQPGDELIDVEVSDFCFFRFFRYPGMTEDLIGGIRDYLAFAREFVPEKFKEAGEP